MSDHDPRIDRSDPVQRAAEDRYIAQRLGREDANETMARNDVFGVGEHAEREREQRLEQIELILDAAEECGWFTWPEDFSAVGRRNMCEELLLTLENNAREEADQFRAATDHRGRP
jgi:hypothetical protein